MSNGYGVPCGDDHAGHRDPLIIRRRPHTLSGPLDDTPAELASRRRLPVMSAAGRIVVSRYVGLSATALMATVSWWVGALPWQHPEQLSPIAPVLRGPGWHRIGLGIWLVAAAALVFSWWVLGNGVRRGQVSPRAVAVTAVLWAIPLLLAAPLASHDVYSYACQGQIYLAGANPYRVTPADLPCPWLTAVSPLWRDHPAPYGPVAIVVSAAAAHGPLAVVVAMLRLAALAGLVLMAVCLPRLAERCGGDPAGALWLGVANPLVLVHLLGGAHNDALMAGFVVAGLTLAIAGRDIGSGVVLAAAVAVKATAVVVLPFAVLLGVTAGRSRLRAFAAVPLAGVATFVVLTLAASLDVGWVGALPVRDQPVSWLSPPSAVGAAIGGLLSLFGVPAAIARTVDTVRVVALYGLLPVALLAAWWHAARAHTSRASLTGAGVALAATVVLAPVVYPWYATAPLAVLAATVAGRARVAFAAVACALTFVVLPDSGNLAIMTRWPGVVVEAVAIAVLAVYAVRRGRQGGRGAIRPRPD
jgi:hypothetical protein